MKSIKGIINNIRFVNKSRIMSNIKLGVKMYPYDDTQDAIEILNSKEQGIIWEYNQTTVEIFDDNFITGYPSADLSSFVAIYPINSKKNPSPRNALIYNSDGTIRFQLTMPKLISKLAIDMLSESDLLNKQGFWFDSVFWNKDSNGNMVTSVWIGFKGEWFEERILFTNTGEFGECLSSGRF